MSETAYHPMNNKFSYCTATVLHVISVEILSTAAQLYKKITLEKACSRWMTLKVALKVIDVHVWLTLGDELYWCSHRSVY